MNRDVLFFDFAYEEYLDIIEQAARRGLRPIMNQPRMRQALAQRGIESAAYSDFAAPGDLEAAAEFKKQVAQRIAAGIAEPGVADGFQSSRGNLLVSGGRDFVHRMLDMAENQATLVRITNRLLDRSDVAAVVMRSCLSAGQRTVANVAMNRGVPVIELSHGNPDHPDVTPPPVQWHYAALGERGAQFMRMRGVPEDRLHTVGGAHWDGLYNEVRRPSRKEARAALGIPEDRPLVVVAGSYATGQILTFASHAQSLVRINEMIARALSTVSHDILLALRPHPGEARQKPGRPPTDHELHAYRQWLAGHGVELVHIDYSDRALARDKVTLFRAADAIIVPDRVSTVTTEAMILGVPVVLLDNPGIAFTPFYEESDGICLAHDEASLASAVSRILSEADYRADLQARSEEALPSLNHGNDGRAALRVVNLIEKLAA